MLFAEMSSIIALGLALAMTGVAVICWRKALYLNTLLMENINLQNEARQSLNSLERDYKKLQQKQQSAKANQTRAERHQEDLRQQLVDGTSKVELLQSRMKTMLEKARNQRDHLIVQNECMTQQLRMADKERAEAEQQVKELTKAQEESRTSTAKEQHAELQSLQRDLNQSRKDTENWRRKCDKISAELVKVDPIATRKIRKRNQHLEHLYQSMKGLKEMAEERSANWETALRHLATWTLTTQDEDVSNNTLRNVPIGPLVANALQAIGSELVNDEHTMLDPELDQIKGSSNQQEGSAD